MSTAFARWLTAILNLSKPRYARARVQEWTAQPVGLSTELIVAAWLCSWGFFYCVACRQHFNGEATHRNASGQSLCSNCFSHAIQPQSTVRGW